MASVSRFHCVPDTKKGQAGDPAGFYIACAAPAVSSLGTLLVDQQAVELKADATCVSVFYSWVSYLTLVQKAAIVSCFFFF